MYGVSDLFTGAWHLIKDPVFPPTSTAARGTVCALERTNTRNTRF